MGVAGCLSGWSVLGTCSTTSCWSCRGSAPAHGWPGSPAGAATRRPVAVGLGLRGSICPPGRALGLGQEGQHSSPAAWVMPPGQTPCHWLQVPQCRLVVLVTGGPLSGTRTCMCTRTHMNPPDAHTNSHALTLHAHVLTPVHIHTHTHTPAHPQAHACTHHTSPLYISITTFSYEGYGAQGPPVHDLGWHRRPPRK